MEKKSVKKTPESKNTKTLDKKTIIVAIIALLVVVGGSLLFSLRKSTSDGHNTFELGINAVKENIKTTLDSNKLAKFVLDTTKTIGIEGTSVANDGSNTKMSYNVGFDFNNKNANGKFDYFDGEGNENEFNAIYANDGLYLSNNELDAPVRLFDVKTINIPVYNIELFEETVDTVAKSLIKASKKVNVDIDDKEIIIDDATINVKASILKDSEKVLPKVIKDVKDDTKFVAFIASLNKLTLDEMNESLDEFAKKQISIEVYTDGNDLKGIDVYNDNEKVLELRYGKSTTLNIYTNQQVINIVKNDNVVSIDKKNGNSIKVRVNITLGDDKIVINDIKENKTYEITSTVTSDSAKVKIVSDDITRDLVINKDTSLLKFDDKNAKRFEDLTPEEIEILKGILEPLL